MMNCVVWAEVRRRHINALEGKVTGGRSLKFRLYSVLARPISRVTVQKRHALLWHTYFLFVCFEMRSDVSRADLEIPV